MRAAVIVALLGAIGCALGAGVDGVLMAHAWLAAALTWGLLGVGALAALLTWGLTGGGWGVIGAPTWRALAATLPVLFLALAVLLVFGLGALFPWTAPVETLPEVVRHKKLYLNVPFLVVRFVIYAVLWLALAFAAGAFSPRRPGGRLSAAGLIVLLYTLTFFGFDWMLSLEPKFYTDVFGLWLVVTLPAAATALVLLRAPIVDDPISVERRADLANLMFALILGWGFMGFAQYIIIWSGNIPHEIEWYLVRGEGVWRVVGWLVCGLFFAVPSLALLFSKLKRNGLWLRRLAVVVLAGYVLQMQWWVLPAAGHPQGQLLWMSPLCLATLAAASLAVGLYRYERQGARHER